MTLRERVPTMASLVGIGLSAWAILLLVTGGSAGVALRFALGAFFCDLLDGALARRWKCESAQGRILDSLGDVLTHVLFPMLFFVVHLGFDAPSALVAATVFIVAALHRLSRFTAEGFVATARGSAYAGVPVFVSYVILMSFAAFPFSVGAFSVMALLASVGMITRVPVPKPATRVSFALSAAGAVLILLTLG